VLKALWIQANDEFIPPKIHNLVILAKSSGLEFTQDKIKFLDYVNGFQFESRYPEYKHEFYKLANKDFSSINLNKIREYYQWLKSRIIL
jgi:hypothetical protein